MHLNRKETSKHLMGFHYFHKYISVSWYSTNEINYFINHFFALYFSIDLDEKVESPESNTASVSTQSASMYLSLV